MRAIIPNKPFSLLKVCIFSGLAVMWLTANAEEVEEFAGVPGDECHYENPIVRETTVQYKYYRRATHHHLHVHHHRYRYRYRSANGLVAYYPFSSPPYDVGCCSCSCCGGESGYYMAPISSDEVTYSIMNGAPIFENGESEEECN